jgi:signal transduction protein with GAF and PtsI domain
MQTERVTYLTSAEHKAALEAFAKARGESVGHVLREATSTYMAEAPLDDEERMSILVAELNEALPAIQASFDRMAAKLEATHAELTELRAQRRAAK